jgi:hypothetical protein
MMTRKSKLVSVNEYLFVTQVSQDRRHFVFGLYRVAKDFAEVISVSYAFGSFSISQAFLAQGEIIKLRSWVVVRREFW